MACSSNTLTRSCEIGVAVRIKYVRHLGAFSWRCSKTLCLDQNSVRQVGQKVSSTRACATCLTPCFIARCTASACFDLRYSPHTSHCQLMPKNYKLFVTAHAARSPTSGSSDASFSFRLKLAGSSRIAQHHCPMEHPSMFSKNDVRVKTLTSSSTDLSHDRLAVRPANRIFIILVDCFLHSLTSKV